MSRKSVVHLSLWLVLVVLLARRERSQAVDVSKFLSQESSVSLTWGSPGGVAFDGANFLVAARSTNGAVLVIRFDTNGVMLGPPLDLGRTGGPPRVAFDGSNFLVAWPDFASTPSDIYGQFIHPDGALTGTPFRIEPGVDAAELGGLAFDGTNYLAVWEADGRKSNGMFSVQGRLISPAGGLTGSRLQISDGATLQRFPDTAWNGESYLVIWTSQMEGTNQWNIRGARLNRQGALSEGVLISETAGQQPWPPCVASDGTSWLVAWTRESGPYLTLNSNLWLPMLYGRIVARGGEASGHETSIRFGGLGQFKPRAVFNQDNYLVAWMERTRVNKDAQTVGWYWRTSARQVDRFGQPSMGGFLIRISFDFSVIDPTAVAVGGGAGRFIVVWETPGSHLMWHSTLNHLSPAFGLQNFAKVSESQAQFDLVGAKRPSYGIEVTTNFVNWSPVIPSGSYINLYSTGRIAAPLPPGGSNLAFFRAFDGLTACRENMRLMHDATDRWIVEENKSGGDTPVDSDLFGAGRYLPSKPLCPNGGQYWFGPVGTWPSCTLGTVAGHTY